MSIIGLGLSIWTDVRGVSHAHSNTAWGRVTGVAAHTYVPKIITISANTDARSVSVFGISANTRTGAASVSVT